MKNKAHGIKIAKWGKCHITKLTLFIKFRDFTSIKKQIHLSSSAHSPFFSCIIHVNMLVKGEKKLLKHSAWLPGSSYYKFYCVSSSINDCFLFLFPFPLIPFSDLSWPELFCLASLRAPGRSHSEVFHSAEPAAHSNLQTGSDRNGLTRGHGETGIAAAFPRHSKLPAI